MMRKTGILGVILLLVLGLVSAAWGRLAAVGPINPNNGFPLYYEDTNGVAVWLPDPTQGGPFGTAGGGGGAPTMTFDAPVTTNPFSVQIGFGTECYYWSCSANLSPNPALGKCTFVLGMLASFVNPLAQNGQQTAFSRVRLTFKGAPAGTYTLRHPYGQETVNSIAGQGIIFTRDTPLLAPLNFSSVLNSGDVGPFLMQSPLPGPFPAAPPPFNTGWLGDGVTVGPITGSPIGFNQLSLTPPANVDLGAGLGVAITTNQFLVSAHQYPVPLPTPVTLKRVTYTRTHFTTYFDAFATSALGASVNLRIAGASPFAMPGGVNELAGLFYARANYLNNATRGPQANPFNPSAPVSVTARVGTNLPTTISQTASDQVLITQARWSAGTQVLTVAARSSDSTLRSPLNVVNPALGALLGNGNFSCPIPPATISVASPAGGVASKAVQIVP